jgi:transposase
LVNTPFHGAQEREKSNGKQGGQPGHPGKTLRQVDNPDKTIYLVEDRDKYINDPRYELQSTQKRQIVEIQCTSTVLEYVNEVFLDTVTGKKITGEFPEGVNAPIQYGKSVETTVTLLNVTQHIPVERTADVMNSLFGLELSTGTVSNMVDNVASTSLLQRFKEAVINSFKIYQVGNFDESGGKLLALTIWIHIAVNKMFVYFFPHKKRGKEGMDAMGILKSFEGLAVHDCWKPYFRFLHCIHCICNAHIVRELQLAIENGQKWAKAMREFILYLDILVNMNGGELSEEQQAWAKKEYERLVRIGYEATGGKELARPPGQKGKRGRIAKSKARNLLERLDFFEDAILRFITDKDVPFSNNDAERPLRLFKLHLKVSGCFRSEKYMENYCLLMSYLESCKKNGIKYFDGLTMLQNGELPEFIEDILATMPDSQDQKAA